VSWLKDLRLDYTGVTDGGLKELKGLRNLKSLSLNGTRITDDGLETVGGLRRLEVLILENTRITDIGLDELAGLSSLSVLSLRRCPNVTDASIKVLALMKGLRYADLTGTGVTKDGAGLLRKALPECNILFDEL
jgi:internalin A